MLKIEPHMMEVHKPTRTISNAAIGIASISKAQLVGMSTCMLSPKNIAAPIKTMAIQETVRTIARLLTLPPMIEPIERPTSINSQYRPAMNVASSYPAP